MSVRRILPAMAVAFLTAAFLAVPVFLYGGDCNAQQSGYTIVMKAQVNNSQFELNGKKTAIDQQSPRTVPMLIEGILFVPARAFFTAVGGRVDWIADDNRMDVQLDHHVIQIWLDNGRILVDGEERKTTMSVESKDGRTMLPASCAASDLLGCDYAWDPFTGAATIQIPNPLDKLKPELVIKVEEFGAMGDGEVDCTQAIQAAIAKAKQYVGPTRIVFGEGEYCVTGSVNGGMLGEAAIGLEGCRWLTLEGKGEKTVIVVKNPRLGAIRVYRSTGITVKGLSIDYDPVPFVQGTITETDPTKGTFDLKVDKGYDFLGTSWMSAAEGRFGMSVVQRDKDATRYGPIAIFASYNKLSGDKWRFQADDPSVLQSGGIPPGARFVYKATRYTEGAFTAVESKNVNLEDYTIYAAPSVATFWAFNENITIRRVVVKPWPGRLLSSNADGIHAFGNRGQVLVENCSFEGMGDDAINFHCRTGVLTNVKSATVIQVPSGLFPCRTGDLLQILDPVKGTVRAEAVAKSVDEDNRVYTIELDRAVAGMVSGSSFQVADNVYNMNACSTGFVIRSNYFGQHRGRAILLRSVGGLIANNVFENTQGNDVVITREGDWPEGPLSRDITITNNTFNGIGLGWAPSITIDAEKSGKQVAEGRDTKNITIEGNSFNHLKNSAVSIRAASHIRIVNNQIHGADGDKLFRSSPVISLDYCDGILIDNLEVEDMDPSTSAIVNIGMSVDQGEKGVKVGNIKAKVRSSTKIIADQRR